jgi:hypothetical protein
MKIGVGFEMLCDFPQATPMIIGVGRHILRARPTLLSQII